MAELITFAAAVDPPRTVFRIALLAFDWMNATVKIHVRDFDGTKLALTPPQSPFGERVIVVQYSGAEATALMTALNKVNLSTQSLHQRVLTKLLADGKIPGGATSGVVD